MPSVYHLVAISGITSFMSCCKDGFTTVVSDDAGVKRNNKLL